MDLDEWELLPDEGYLEINDDRGKKIYSRKHTKGSRSVFQMNYFMCPPKSAPEFVDKTRPDQLLPVPIDLEPKTSKPHEDDGDPGLVKKEAPKIPVEININVPPAASEKTESFKEQDPVSQIFFKKMKETEFVDMKVESPKSNGTKGIMPQIEAFPFEEGGDQRKVDGSDMDLDDESDIEESGLNIWKWSLTGIGAICSFGVAAATVCIIILSSHRKNKHPQHNQKLQFQIYTSDKRVKQAVQHASKINEAVSAVRGVPFTRAHITFGGYYDAPV